MLYQDALKWKDRYVTRKSGTLIGRKVQVTFVNEGANGNGYMTIAYPDTERFCYECNPDNYLLWEEFQKTGHAPNPDRLAACFLKISERQKKFGIIIGDKVYVIIRAEDHIPYLVMQILLEQKVLRRAGTLGKVLKENGTSYKDFKIKTHTARQYCPNQSVTLYEILVPLAVLV
ncbi:MAG: hypothetical protein Q8N68_01090 [bacterium]|nr:hypothetical protein [bacterium]